MKSHGDLSQTPGSNEVSPTRRKAMNSGERLKLVRANLGMTAREGGIFSKLIAEAEGNNEFLVSGPWLTQIENEKTALPSIYKLFTLASIYGLSYSTLLEMYGVDLKKLNVFHSRLPVAKTHLAQYEVTTEPRPAPLDLPVRFDAGLNLSQTNLLSRMIETWGKVPMEFVQHLDLRHRLYGFVGFSDYTLYPLLRPGSFLEIDPELKNPRSRPIRSEFDLPIYLFDIRTEYACTSSYIIDANRLITAHPLPAFM